MKKIKEHALSEIGYKAIEDQAEGHAKAPPGKVKLVSMQSRCKQATDLRFVPLDIHLEFDRQEQRRLKVSERYKTSFVTASEISVIGCSGRVLTIQPLNKQAIHTTATLTHYAEKLTNCGFFQINRNMLINLKYVRELRGGNKRHVVVNGEEISVSRRIWQALVLVLDDFYG